MQKKIYPAVHHIEYLMPTLPMSGTILPSYWNILYQAKSDLNLY